MGFATFPHRGHHVVGVVLQGVIGGGGGGGAAAVVIHPETATHIKETHGGAQASQLYVELTGLLQGVLEDGDVIDLAAHMEVQ